MNWRATLVAQLDALPAQRYIIGYSGGLDSTALLWLCREWLASSNRPVTLLAVHINHQLSPAANAWQQHCQKQCEDWGIAFHTISVSVDRAAGGLEQAARQARYSALAKLCQPGDALLLAHHLNDQAETFLARALRGSGPAGLGAIRMQRDWQGVHLVRPLLNVPRTELTSLANQHDLVWVDDESNLDDALERNYIRHQLLPAMEARWPQALKSLARSAELAQVEHQALMRLIARDCSQAIDTQRTLDLAAWQTLPGDEQSLWLRYWLSAFDHELPSQAVLSQLCTQANQARADAQLVVQWGQRQIRRFKGRLWCIAQLAPLDPCWSCLADLTEQQALGPGQGTVIWQSSPIAGQTGMRAELLEKHLEWRLRQGGEVFRPAGRTLRTLKKWLQDSQLPPWLRERLPLLYCGDQLVLVPGLGVAAAYAAPPEGAALWVQWLPPATS